MSTQPDETARHPQDAVSRQMQLAERDAARKDRLLQELRDELAATEYKLVHSRLESAEYLRQIGRLEDRLTLLFNSASWRLAAPVRRAAHLMGRLRAFMGGPPPKVLPGPAPPAEPEPEPPVTLSLREQAILQRLQRPGLKQPV